MKMQVFYWPREVFVVMCALIYLYFWQQGLSVKKKLCRLKTLMLFKITFVGPHLLHHSRTFPWL